MESLFHWDSSNPINPSNPTSPINRFKMLMGFLVEVTSIFPNKSRRDFVRGGFSIQGGIILSLLLEELPPTKSCKTDQADTEQ
jgi:hypothetical protein